MSDTVFIIPAELTDNSADIFTVIGKALYIAQHFESNCRVIAALLNIKQVLAHNEIGPLDSKPFRQHVDKLWKRSLAKNIQHLRIHNIPDELLPFLDAARVARNRIAHEITLGLEHKLEYDHLRKDLEEELRHSALDIAKANLLIGILISTLNREPIPQAVLDKFYITSVSEWALKPQKSPNMNFQRTGLPARRCAVPENPRR